MSRRTQLQSRQNDSKNHTVIRFVSTSAKFGICSVLGLDGTLVEDKISTVHSRLTVNILASTSTSVQFRPTTVQGLDLALQWHNSELTSESMLIPYSKISKDDKRQRVTKRCRLSLLTNITLIIQYESKCGGREGFAGSAANEYSSAHHVT